MQKFNVDLAPFRRVTDMSGARRGLTHFAQGVRRVSGRVGTVVLLPRRPAAFLCIHAHTDTPDAVPSVIMA
jgi:hypothetical protein